MGGRFNAVAVMLFICIPAMAAIGPPPPWYYWLLWALAIAALWNPALTVVRNFRRTDTYEVQPDFNSTTGDKTAEQYLAERKADPVKAIAIEKARQRSGRAKGGTNVT